MSVGEVDGDDDDGGDDGDDDGDHDDGDHDDGDHDDGDRHHHHTTYRGLWIYSCIFIPRSLFLSCWCCTAVYGMLWLVHGRVGFGKIRLAE